MGEGKIPEKISIGRIVHYRTNVGRVFPAIVSKVWSESCVNLHVFNGDHGDTHFVTSALFLGGGAEAGTLDASYPPGWSWPPRREV